MAHIRVGRWGDADRAGIVTPLMVKINISFVRLTRLDRQHYSVRSFA